MIIFKLIFLHKILSLKIFHSCLPDITQSVGAMSACKDWVASFRHVRTCQVYQWNFMHFKNVSRVENIHISHYIEQTEFCTLQNLHNRRQTSHPLLLFPDFKGMIPD